jgi:hypothetical protein
MGHYILCFPGLRCRPYAPWGIRALRLSPPGFVPLSGLSRSSEVRALDFVSGVATSEIGVGAQAVGVACSQSHVSLLPDYQPRFVVPLLTGFYSSTSSRFVSPLAPPLIVQDLLPCHSLLYSLQADCVRDLLNLQTGPHSLASRLFG